MLYVRSVLNRFSLKTSTLAKYVLLRPSRWGPALRLISALIRQQSTVRLRSDGVWLFAGASRGSGIWCALTGLDYEKELPQMIHMMRPGMVFVDVGANVGTYSIRAARLLGLSGKVFSFEPLQANRNRLEAAIAANATHNVVVSAAAVGDRNGMVTLYDAGRESSASVCHTTGIAFNARMITLDTFVDETGLQRLDWIKMDIEGAEPLVVRGARELIHRFKPAFLFENHEGGAETQHLLHAAGYIIGRISENGLLEKTETGTNLFAFHPENADSRAVLGIRHSV